jgi:hypothetical protein
MSLAQFGFGIAVFAVPDYLTKLKRLLANPVALAWIGLYLLFIFGGFASQDLDYFLKEIRTKMPIWVMPAALAFMPALSKRNHSLVLHFFVAGCMVAMVAGWYNAFTGNVVDRRDLSPLVSHIRLGLYLVLSLFILVRFIIPKNADIRFLPKGVYMAIFIVLLFWLFYLKSFTAVIFFLILFPATLLFLLMPRIKRNLRIGLFGIFAIGAVGIASYLVHSVSQFYSYSPVDYASLPKRTALGNEYIHDSTIFTTENGNRIWIYLQFDEMRATWNEKSTIKFDSLDKKGNLVRSTLIRYLASKNLPRDAEGINTLVADDIKNIENGIPNYLYGEAFNIKGRIYETLWEIEVYRGSGDPNGKSLSARIEMWKASVSAIRKSPISGYGTGDVRHALQSELRARDSKLLYHRQFGPHNQYLAVLLAIGLPGLCWMFFAFLLPLFNAGYKPSFLFYVLLGILLLSALNEDIFETQASVTFFAFAFHFLLMDGRRLKTNPGSDRDNGNGA